MADERHGSGNDDPKDHNLAPVGPRDHLLSVLAALCDRIDAGVDVTLTLPGGVVTGTMVGVEEWFRLFAEAFAGAFPPGASQNEMLERFRSMGTLAKKELVESKVGYSDYIHLKDAHYVTGSDLLPSHGTKGMLYRCLAPEISGFTLGRLGLGG